VREAPQPALELRVRRPLGEPRRDVAELRRAAVRMQARKLSGDFSYHIPMSTRLPS
jgi:hypothetical protein